MKGVLNKVLIGLGLVAVAGATAYKLGAFDGYLAEEESESLYPGDNAEPAVVVEGEPEVTVTE